MPAANCQMRFSSTPERMISRATRCGLPSVMVPVLSIAMRVSLRASSRYTPPLIRMPRRAAAARPLTTVTGVEITSAQGQAMTSSTSALYIPVNHVQPANQGPNAATARAMTNTAGV